MARHDRWRDEREREREGRHWDFDREERLMRSRPDYGQTDYDVGGWRGREDRDYRDYRDYDFGRMSPTYGSAPADPLFGAGGGWGPSYPYASPYPEGRDYGLEDERDDRRRRRYMPSPPEGRGEEPRSWLDKAGDQFASWFGDRNAERRRRWDEVRREEHRGRGPRGYRRSDARVVEDVNDRLTDDAWLDATDIVVSADNGEVTLSGQVSSREDKRRAERLAEGVQGVLDVHNNIRIRRDYDEEVREAVGPGNFER